MRTVPRTLADAFTMLIDCPNGGWHNWRPSGKPGERFCTRCTAIYDPIWRVRIKLAEKMGELN